MTSFHKNATFLILSMICAILLTELAFEEIEIETVSGL